MNNLALGQRLYGSDEPLVVPIKGPQAKFPELITAENFPLFPFTDQFNTGFELNPANKIVSSLSDFFLKFYLVDGGRFDSPCTWMG